ncbi:uncharacterized protein L969DRAFT_453269 [Mixia osmundae IAM 14324]|nr:uncharacterized protein L969DRAFT_453269 [Mixia osmundae IAM 14324]KEI39509.1 hypothetical protein L969DRAFT_453269 [Mixia osmundae IAM 14324]
MYDGKMTLPGVTSELPDPMLESLDSNLPFEQHDTLRAAASTARDGMSGEPKFHLFTPSASSRRDLAVSTSGFHLQIHGKHLGADLSPTSAEEQISSDDSPSRVLSTVRGFPAAVAWPTATLTGSATVPARQTQPGQKNFDLSNWQDDLEAIRGTSSVPRHLATLRQFSQPETEIRSGRAIGLPEELDVEIGASGTSPLEWHHRQQVLTRRDQVIADACHADPAPPEEEETRATRRRSLSRTSSRTDYLPRAGTSRALSELAESTEPCHRSPRSLSGVKKSSSAPGVATVALTGSARYQTRTHRKRTSSSCASLASSLSSTSLHNAHNVLSSNSIGSLQMTTRSRSGSASASGKRPAPLNLHSSSRSSKSFPDFADLPVASTSQASLMRHQNESSATTSQSSSMNSLKHSQSSARMSSSSSTSATSDEFLGTPTLSNKGTDCTGRTSDDLLRDDDAFCGFDEDLEPMPGARRSSQVAFQDDDGDDEALPRATKLATAIGFFKNQQTTTEKHARVKLPRIASPFGPSSWLNNPSFGRSSSYGPPPPPDEAAAAAAYAEQENVTPSSHTSSQASILTADSMTPTKVSPARGDEMQDISFGESQSSDESVLAQRSAHADHQSHIDASAAARAFEYFDGGAYASPRQRTKTWTSTMSAHKPDYSLAAPSSPISNKIERDSPSPSSVFAAPQTRQKGKSISHASTTARPWLEQAAPPSPAPSKSVMRALSPAALNRGPEAAHAAAANVHKVISVDNLALNNTHRSSPFSRPGTTTTPGGTSHMVHPSVHPLRNTQNIASPINVRKRNANGHVVMSSGTSILTRGGSRLAFHSPMVAAESSPLSRNVEDTAMSEGRSLQTPSRPVSTPMRKALTASGSSSSPSRHGSISPHAPSLSPSQHAQYDAALSTRSSARHPVIAQLSRSNGPGAFSTPPAYKTVKPLQAAFLSTGLISKRSRPRVASNVSLAPPFGLLVAGADVALNDDESFESGDMSYLASAHPGVLQRGPVMPDTPAKKVPFTAEPTVEACPASDCSASSSVPEDRMLLSAYEFPNRPGSRPHQTRASSPLGSTASSESGSSFMNSDAASKSPSVRHAARAARPPMFRRRSSGQISIGPDGSFTGLDRSGGSQRSLMHLRDKDPMTPTRAHAHAQANHSLMAEATRAGPVTPMLSEFPAWSLTGNNEPPAPSPALHAKPPAPVRRPAYITRHTSSVLISRRQQELQSPSRFETCFVIQRSIGCGEFSEAFEVQDRSTGQVSAVKRTKHAFGGPKDRLRRLEEVDILRHLSNESDPSRHVINLIDAWEQSGHLYIQTELCQYGNLAFFLEEYGRLHEVLDEGRVWKILTEIAQGLAQVNAAGVLHLDLKPANVFVTDSGTLKIGDFGLATRWPRTTPYSIIRGAAVASPGWDADSVSFSAGIEADAMRTRSQTTSTTVLQDFEREGDREYIAPEVMSGEYGFAADVFSLGLIVLEAAVNVVMPENGPTWHKLRSDDLSDVDFSKTSSELSSLLRSLLASKPCVRISCEAILSHPGVARARAYVGPEGRAAQGAILPEDENFLAAILARNHDNDDDMDLDL